MPWPPPPPAPAAPVALLDCRARPVTSPPEGVTHTRPADAHAALPARAHHMSTLLILLPLRIFLAAGWLRAAAEKVIASDWWNGTELRQFLVTEREMAIPFTRPVTDHVVDPGAPIVAFVVMAAELLCGLALLTGRRMRSALHVGVALNVAFVLAGRVNPSAFYLVMEIALLFAIADGVIGTTPTRPSRRTVVAGLTWLAVGCAFVPFFRTMEPADVISDPAIMLSFLSVIVGGGLLFRWSAEHVGHAAPVVPRRTDVWSRRITSWAVASPTPRERTTRDRTARDLDA